MGDRNNYCMSINSVAWNTLQTLDPSFYIS